MTNIPTAHFDKDHFMNPHNAPVISDAKIISAMRKYGGHFAQALAEALTRADDENFRRIREAFPEMFEVYAKFAEKDETK